MLHKSFKPAKCKTSLKLATSRIKLMKNKKGVQMNQMKRELAQLLESGQDRTARIRVEHLIREEKMVAAYDLIEIYCELIAARLPIIESQKNCPIDLKEAITSVIFASPRCADIPELLDVKKHFTAKYGKEFVTSALELRPNCGVGRMLVEKLSAIAPDGQTKVKVLNAIAEEHNIKWDSQSFEEKDSKPADDLLNGPSTFEKASELHAETPKIQVPNVQATSSHDEHVRPSNFTEENTRSSLNNQIFSSTEPGGIKTTTTTNHPGFKSSGKGDERMKVRHSFSGDDDAFSSGRQNWNMEFKDATSAAQAAAESAERASMAARAAAELSSREHITRQYSSESHKSINDSIRHKRPGTSKFPGEHFASVPVNNSFHDRNSKLQNEQIGSDEHHNLAGDGERFGDDHGNTKRLGSSHSASLRSRKASVDDDTFVNSVQKPDGYSEKSLYKETIKADKEPLYSKMDTKKQSVDPRVENVSRWQDDFKSENVDQFGEARLEKQHSTSSSRSHSSTNSDDYNVSNNYHQKFGNDDSEDPFVGNDHESIHIDTAKMGSYDDSVAYDEYDFDDIGPKYDEGESSLGRNSPTSPTTTVDTWNPRRNTIKSPEKSTSQPHFSAEHHSLFSESLANSVDPSESDNVPVIPYEFDGPKFDSEDEQEKTSHGGIIDSSIFSHKQNVFSLDPEPAQDENYGLTGSSFEKRNSGSDKRSRFGSSSSDDLDNVEVHLKSDQVTVLNVESQKKFDSGESPANYLSPRFSKSQLELNDIGSKSSIAADEWNVRESSRLSFAHIDKDNVHSRDTLKDDELLDQSSTQGENKLSFGTLRGGFRNKGYRHPPYNRKPSGDDASSLTQKAAVESSTLIEQQVASPPSVRSSINSSMSNNADKNSSFGTSVARSDSDSDLDSDSNSDSDNDNLGEEVSQKTTSRRQASYAQKSSKRLNMKSSFRPPVATYFDLDNDNDDSKEDIPKQTLPNKSHLGSGISRRTKAYPPSTETSSYSKVQAGSEASVSPNFINERKPTRSHHGAETSIKSRFQTRSSGHVGSEEQPSSAEKAASKAMTVSKISSREENLNSSAVEKPSSPMRNTRPSGNLQNSKTSTPKAEPPTREDSAKRASHVHPKLPDYDSIAAQLQSLRKDRQ